MARIVLESTLKLSPGSYRRTLSSIPKALSACRFRASERYLKRLARLSTGKYNALVSILQDIGNYRSSWINLVVPQHTVLEKVAFESIPAYFFEPWIEVGKKGAVLDLTRINDIRIRYNRLARAIENRIGQSDLSSTRIMRLEDVVNEKIKLFDRLGQMPGSTPEQLLNILVDGIRFGNFLGVPFLNIRLLEISNQAEQWFGQLLYTSQAWGKSKYPTRKPVITTLESIVRAEPINDPVKIWLVDFRDENSFEAAGLMIDKESIENDLAETKGPTKLMIIRVATQEEGPRLVVYKHNLVHQDEKMEPADFFPTDPVERRSFEVQIYNLYHALAENLERISGRTGKAAYHIEKISGPRKAASVRRYSNHLTADLLFNFNSVGRYPRTPEEYHNFLKPILDEKGRFPEDFEALTIEGTFSPPLIDNHYSLARRGKIFEIERFTPSLEAPNLRNRFIFDADLLCQMASTIYGTKGVSYPRRSFYDNRLFQADMVPFIRNEGRPVSFAAISEYWANLPPEYGERELYYAFIHYVMTMEEFQSFGLTSHSITEGMSYLFWRYIRSKNKKSFLMNKDGNLKNKWFMMWVAAHTGRLAAFKEWSRFGEIPPESIPLAQIIYQDAHRRIYFQDRSDSIEGQGSYARDKKCYPGIARYKVFKDKVILSKKEEKIPESKLSEWLNYIGGVEGVAQGNSLYLGGLVRFGGIRRSRRHEKKRGNRGAGARAGEWIREKIVRK